MKKSRLTPWFCAVMALLMSTMFAVDVFAETTVTRMRVNRRVEPVGVDAGYVMFSWNLLDETRNTMQKSYRIRVSDSQDALNGDSLVWDSGTVESSQMIEISYDGEPLAPSMRYFWAVEIVNNRDERTESEATFVTGVGEWQANWISIDRENADPLPIFRKSFDADAKKIDYAVAHICGLGHYELRLNGEKVGQSFIDPGWTNYRKTCLYSSYDVTSQLRSGENVLGVLLGNGMYNVPGGRYVKFTGSFGMPKHICQLEIVYDDGTREIVASDETWRASLGPITFSCVYGGEDFDANRVEAGWDKPGFDDANNAKWHAAKIVESPGGVLRPQEAPPVTVAETLKPVSLERLPDGRYVADFGYNFSGRPRIGVRGQSGDAIKVTTAEIRDRVWEGHSYAYTLCGSGECLPLEKVDDLPNNTDKTTELLLPKFTYFGFQFLYIEGAVLESDRTEADADKPTLVFAEADFTTSSAERVGTFRCSNEMVNEIDAMIERSVRSNLQSVLTDCPHREKLGWLEVSHLMGPSIMSRFDVQNLYRKICRDTTESQLENGLVPDIAPEYTRFSAGFFESPEWGSASVLLPYQLFHVYGDEQIVHQQMETMERYVDYLTSTRNEQGLVKAGLGDWYDWSPEKGHAGYSQHTPGELTATAMLSECASALDSMRYFTDISTDHKGGKYCDLANQVREDYIKAYVKDDGTVATGSQAAQAITLANLLFDYWNEGEDSFLLKIWKRFQESMEKAGNRPTTGEVAFRYLLKALPGEVAWEVVTGTEKPGYGYMLKHCGMKTLSETWDGPGSSMNHCMFGHAQEWFTQSIAGIFLKPTFFETAIFNPIPVGDLTWAEGTWICPYGKIVSSWKIEGDRLKYHVEIPIGFNSAGIIIPMSNKSYGFDVKIPATREEYWKENPQPEDWSLIMLDGKPISEFSDVRIYDGNVHVVEIEITNPSGTYDFEVPYAMTNDK